MKQVINIYKKHQFNVDNFIMTLIKSLPKDYITHADKILKDNQFIQLIYAVNSYYVQISPTICKKNRETMSLNADKSHYFTKLHLDDGFYISNPYIHYRTGRASISIVRQMEDVYYVFDCNLIELLEELKLIEYNGVHDKFKKSVYFLGSTLLAFVAIALIGYGGYTFFHLMIDLQGNDFLHDIFKAIISITLGLAIYDLAKQIFEHEVIFNSFHHEDDKEYKVLGKFLISIIIALSIETLMVVFKIALDDYKELLSAFYLLIGVTIMFVGLAYFYKTIKTSSCDRD
jgi:hypothetical protein